MKLSSEWLLSGFALKLHIFSFVFGGGGPNQLTVLNVLHFCFCGNKFTLVVMFSQFIDKGVEILLQFIAVYIFWRRYILKILCLVMILSSQKFLDYTDLLCFDRDSFN